MTLRWLICFSASLLPLCGAAVSGRVELRDSRYAAVRNHHDYSGVVIALTPAESTAPPVAGNEVCRLRDIVSAACEVFSPTAEAQSVTVEVDVPAGIELPLERARMERVFLNLIDNSLGVMPLGGTLSITAKIEASSVMVRVRHTGPGFRRRSARVCSTLL